MEVTKEEMMHERKSCEKVNSVNTHIPTYKHHDDYEQSLIYIEQFSKSLQSIANLQLIARLMLDLGDLQMIATFLQRPIRLLACLYQHSKDPITHRLS